MQRTPQRVAREDMFEPHAAYASSNAG
jgi:hypothetical protein